MTDTDIRTTLGLISTGANRTELGLLNISAIGAALTKILSETVIFSDSLIKCIYKQNMSTITIDDTYILGVQKLLTAMLVGSDTYSRSYTGFRSYSDILIENDTFNKLISLYEKKESLSLVDSKEALIMKILSDNASIVDSYSKVLFFARTLVAQMLLNDVFQRAGTYYRLYTDAAVLSDILNIGYSEIIIAVISLSDAIYRETLKIISSVLTLSDIYNRTATLGRSIADVLDIADIYNRTVSYIRSVTDVLKLIDYNWSGFPPIHAYIEYFDYGKIIINYIYG